MPGIFFRVDPHRHLLRADLPYHALRINGTRKVQGKNSQVARRCCARRGTGASVRERPACRLSPSSVKSRKPSSSSPAAGPPHASWFEMFHRCSGKALRVKVIYPRLHCKGGRRAFPRSVDSSAPRRADRETWSPGRTPPICGVDRFHSHQPSLSLRAAYCQTTRSISTQRPLDCGDFSAFTVMRTRTRTGLQRACIVQRNLLRASRSRSIGVDIRSRRAVHRYLRPAAPRPLEAVDHRIASLEAEFDVRFPGIAGAVVVVITARDRLVLPDGKTFSDSGFRRSRRPLFITGAPFWLSDNSTLSNSIHVSEDASFFSPATVSVTVCSP